jgi:hypothetical protein
MRYNEFRNTLNTFIATVRVVTDSSSLTVRTSVNAETQSQATAILKRLFGEGNVLNVAQKISEQGKTRVLSSDELRVKSLADQAKRLKQQEKELKARNALTKAQQNMAKLVEWANATNADISNASI